MSDLTQRSRPGGETETAENRWAATDSSVGREGAPVAQFDDAVRCSKCGHALTAPRSVELEIGPVCRKAGAA